ncbi:MAG: hypothetical protein ACI8PT_002364 [Gammaproteobacteria bacterium]|jgi:hypothetical protein
MRNWSITNMLPTNVRVALRVHRKSPVTRVPFPAHSRHVMEVGEQRCLLERPSPRTFGRDVYRSPSRVRAEPLSTATWPRHN